MKRFIICLAAIFFAASSEVFAGNLTRERFAELTAPVIFSGGTSESVVIEDMQNPSPEITAVVSAGIIKLNQGAFETERYVTNYELTEGLVKAWEIRMGEFSPPALGGFSEGYSDLNADEKRVLDKAAMLGILPSNGNFSKDAYADVNDAEMYIKKITEAINIMKVHGFEDIVTGFRIENELTGTPRRGSKVKFFASVNEEPEFDSAVIIIALYDGKTLVDVSHKTYNGLQGKDFAVMHSEIEIPNDEGNYKVKAFIFDSLKSLVPIYEYKLIQ